MPALRERSGDIPEIAEAILQRLARRASSAAPADLARRRCALLEALPFPGNVRELENVLERALTLSTGGVITPEHIRLRADARGSGGRTSAAADRRQPLRAAPRSATQLESIEREAIVKALEKTRYNKTAAAKLLGMSFRALRYRIKKLGIE